MRKLISTIAAMALFMTLVAAQQAMAAAVNNTVNRTITNTVTITHFEDVKGTSMDVTGLSASVDVSVNFVYSVTVVPNPTAQPGSYSDCVVYPVTVTNTGNTDDTFNMSYAVGSGWTPNSVAFYTNAGCTLALAGNNTGNLAKNGGAINLWVKLCIPDSSSGDSGANVEHFIGTSAGDPSVTKASDSEDATTTISAANLDGSSKTADTTNYKAGDTITYTIHLVNSGAVDATHVIVTDPIPTHLTFAASADGSLVGSDFVSSEVTVPAKVGAVNGTKDISFTATVNNGTPNMSVPNTASIAFKSGGNPTPEPPVTKSVTMLVDAPNLTVTKTADKANASPGDTITYTVTVANTGRDTARAVAISDTLSGFVTFGAFLGGGSAPVNCAPAEAAGVISGHPNNPVLDQLGAGVTMTFKYTVTVNNTP